MPRGSKNIIGGTDFTKGWDNRFGATVHVGFVSKIEVDSERASVRVIMPDKVDHNGTPLNTKPIPVLQVASQAKRQFAVPRLGTPVAIIKMPTGTSNYLVVGSFYSKANPPPVTNPNLDYVIYDDGSVMQFDASNGEQLWQLKGKMTWDNDKGADLKFKEAVLLDAGAGNITIKSTGTILLDGATVKLKGTNIIFEGNINHTGNMETSGVHHDSLGYHTSSSEREQLLQRIEALEARVATLEQGAVADTHRQALGIKP